MADFSSDKKYNYLWQNSKFKDFALSGSNISQFVNDAGYVTSSVAISASYALTASYALNGGVTQLLAGPNISLSPTNGLGQVTVSATLSGSTIFNTATGSYGSFYDTTTQTNPIANVARSMSFNSTDITNGVSISGSTSPFNTYIKTINAGVYNIQFSAQVDKTDGGTDDVIIWLRKNGIDLTDTATTLTLPTNNSKVVAAWNWFVLSSAGDYYQIIWRSADTDLRLLAEPITGTHPGIPSVILTVNRVDQFLSNTGSFSGSFNGSFTGSLSGTASYATQALSASFAPSTPAFPFTGSALITGSLGVTGSYSSRLVSPSAYLWQTHFSGERFDSTTLQGKVYIKTNYPFVEDFYIGKNSGSANNDTSTNGGIHYSHQGQFTVRNTQTSGFYGVTLNADQNLEQRVGIDTGRNSFGFGWSLRNFTNSTDYINFAHNSNRVGIGWNDKTTSLLGATLDVKATGSLSTDIAFRVRNSANNLNLFQVNGDNSIYLLGEADAGTVRITRPSGHNVLFQQRATSTLPSQLIFNSFGSGGSIPQIVFDAASTGGSISFNIHRYTFGLSTLTGSGIQSSFGATTSAGFFMRNSLGYDTAGTIPTTTPIDHFIQYSADRNGIAGKASPHFRTEDGTVVWLGDESRLFNVTASSIISNGSITVGNITSTPSTENTLNVYPPFAGGTGEGGQILLAASGGLYTSASMLDTWQNYFRILRGTNTGGSTAQLVGLDLQTGNLSIAGAVIPSAWAAGQVIKDTMLSNTEVTVSTTTIATSTSDTDFVTYSYTPVSSNSYLIIHYHLASYDFSGGTGNDSYISRIKVDGSEITYSTQSTVNGNRTGVLFPLTGRYTNSNTTAKSIVVACRRNSADDSITIVNSSTSMWLRITEIAR